VYVTPGDREQIVVRLNSTVVKAVPLPQTAASIDSHACAADLPDGSRIEFAQSRRTGNIELTVREHAPRTEPAEGTTRGPVSNFKTVPKVVVPPQTPHAGMPAANADFYSDLQSLENRPSIAGRCGVLEDLMAGNDGDAACGSTARAAAPAVVRGSAGMDLTRIIEAWPHLSRKTRAAMVALVDQVEEVRRPPSPGRRRSRKTSSSQP